MPYLKRAGRIVTFHCERCDSYSPTQALHLTGDGAWHVAEAIASETLTELDRLFPSLAGQHV